MFTQWDRIYSPMMHTPQHQLLRKFYTTDNSFASPSLQKPFTTSLKQLHGLGTSLGILIQCAYFCQGFSPPTALHYKNLRRIHIQRDFFLLTTNCHVYKILCRLRISCRPDLSLQPCRHLYIFLCVDQHTRLRLRLLYRSSGHRVSIVNHTPDFTQLDTETYYLLVLLCYKQPSPYCCLFLTNQLIPTSVQGAFTFINRYVVQCT